MVSKRTERPVTSKVDCAVRTCGHRAMKQAHQLPFCPTHWRALPAKVRDGISAAAHGSVYDLDAVSDATALVAEARRLLKAQGVGT